MQTNDKHRPLCRERMQRLHEVIVRDTKAEGRQNRFGNHNAGENDDGKVNEKQGIYHVIQALLPAKVTEKPPGHFDNPFPVQQ